MFSALVFGESEVEMALLQISEPGQSHEPRRQKRAIGIDLGTTNSLVATVLSGSAITLEDEQGRHILPSVVWYGERERQVGRLALDQVSCDPLNTIISVKRLMGRGVEDLKMMGGIMPYHFSTVSSSMPFIETSSGSVSPVEVSSEILKVLVARAEKSLGGALDGAVITVPAYFDDAQRQATKDAAKLAGINVYRLLNEPTAAAIAYALDADIDDSDGVIAVYDLGGGTFDVTILNLEKGVFQVLATGGDTALGGDDLDRLLSEWILEQSGCVGQHLSNEELREVIMLACSVKESLTNSESIDITFRQWSGKISREQFNSIIDPLVDRTIHVFQGVLRDAEMKTSDILEVIMVGGSTRIPRVRAQVAEFAGRQPLITIDPDRVVAIGAALQADVLAGNLLGDSMLLLDVIPLSLGLETMGGVMEKIIHRNTTIPFNSSQEFTSARDGQTAMKVHVFQGERNLVRDNRSLAQFELKGIPPLPAGTAKIRVVFQVDADGLLNVTAKELSTGVTSSVQVKPSYGLGDDDISRMIKEAHEYAGDDRDNRFLKEQEVEADRMIDALVIALDKDGKELLSVEERKLLKDDVKQLRLVRSSGSADVIMAEVKRVNGTSEEFAARRMNQGVRRALSGQRIDDFEDS
ncbi:MAG: Fe-S protein assembly chaperone HscA [Candidatus Endonucleobacter bathymodioli]|uniref:Chaperone protein HscA homolog n=1 Tax=Candidatus Endonucleibacter bathymodioli TaxID=539814 RepID=A0AA90P0J2_9GAMM|nr:Fe-S protein assembly chaperone HscA [Candidatus Endonucleobacter bathymodioli]